MASGNPNTSSGSNSRFTTMNPSPSPSSSSTTTSTPSNLHRRNSSKGAWNTNRRNNNNGNNGNGNGNNGNDYSNESSQSSFDPVSKHMDDRLLFGLIKSVGCTATVTVSSGSIFKGLLYTTSELTNFGFSIVLKYPEILKLSDSDLKNDNFNSNNLNESLIIYDKDLMLLKIDDVDLSSSSTTTTTTTTTTSPNKSTPSSNNNSNAKLGFRTDTDISAISGIREHELKKWVPDENDSSLSNMGGLEDDQDFETFGSLSNNNNNINNNNRNNAGGSWDQFEVNERKFGIQSSYDEELYTTKLDTNAPDFQQRLAEAEKIAKEIESQAYNGDIHLAEERGIIIDDSGVDEEDKYSGVLRDDPAASITSSTQRSSITSSNANKNGGALLMGLLKANAKPSVQKEFKPATPGAYVPPSQRAAKFHGDPAIINSSAVPSTSSSSTSGIPQKPSTNDIVLIQILQFQQNQNFQMDQTIQSLQKLVN
ncbi:unnamed protein product [[Candida] boidinii]|uniref:Unnamed protein product n=1 Tax=Candida boidinii TaxID=5477 RepID=A0ACB5TLP7_CANBO|nr:unnamed protein product [[Candida] boidinii]